MSKKTNSLLTLALVVLSVTVVTLGWGLLRKSQLEGSSQELAINITLSIFGNLDVNPLLDSAHASLMEQFTPESLEREMLNYAEMLGRLELIESISGSAEVALLPIADDNPVANYELITSFTGNATSIFIDMVYENESWAVTGYHVMYKELDA